MASLFVTLAFYWANCLTLQCYMFCVLTLTSAMRSYNDIAVSAVFTVVLLI